MKDTANGRSRALQAVTLTVLLILGGWLWGRAAGHDLSKGNANASGQSSVRPVKGRSRPKIAGPSEPVEKNLEPREADLLAQISPETLVPRDRFHPRDPSEWQGMLVNLAQPQICEASWTCGFALACKEQSCGPCEVNRDCAQGESCVLDHCVLADHVECRSQKDCKHLGAEALCILSGLTSGDPRGNAAMRAFCSSGTGGREMTEAAARELAPKPGSRGAPPPAVAKNDLVHALWDDDAKKKLVEEAARDDP